MKDSPTEEEWLRTQRAEQFTRVSYNSALLMEFETVSTTMTERRGGITPTINPLIGRLMHEWLLYRNCVWYQKHHCSNKTVG